MYTLTLLDQEHIGWKSRKLIARAIRYFLPKGHLPTPRGTWGKFFFGGETRGGVEKVACWSIKAAISLKRAKIEKKLLWKAYKNSSTLFRMVPSRSPTASSSHDWGSQPPPKSSLAIISGMGEATDFKFGQYFQRVHPKKPINNFRVKGACTYPGTAQIF